MPWFWIIAYFYLLALITSAIGGVFNWQRLNTTLRLVTILLCAYALTELVSIIFRWFHFKSRVHHHILSLLELFLIVSSYLSLRGQFNKRSAFIVFISSMLIIVGSAEYIQPIKTINTYVLVFEGVLFVILSIHALFILMISEEIKLLKDPQFWFWTLEMVGGAVSVLYWGLYLIATDKYEDIFHKMEIGNAIVNLAIYTPLAYAMVMVPKRRAKL